MELTTNQTTPDGTHTETTKEDTTYKTTEVIQLGAKIIVLKDQVKNP